MRTFLRLLPVLLVAALLSTLALAAGNYTLGQELAAGATPNAAPSGASAGFPLHGDPSAIRQLSVTVVDVRDASTGDGLDVIAVAREEAWCYNSTGDAGSQWSRQPQLDLYLDGGAASGVVDDGVPNGLTGTVSVPLGLPCSRIYYNTATLNLAFDAGTGLVHRRTITQTN